MMETVAKAEARDEVMPIGDARCVEVDVRRAELVDGHRRYDALHAEAANSAGHFGNEALALVERRRGAQDIYQAAQDRYIDSFARLAKIVDAFEQEAVAAEL